MKRFLLLLFIPLISQAQTIATYQGQVLDSKKKPIEFATVLVQETGITAYSDVAGKFKFPINVRQFPIITLKISFVGMNTILAKVNLQNPKHEAVFILQELTLTLNDVQVTEKQKGENSNSSITFDRQAIEQVQAFSLTDILNALPGKATVAPNLQTMQNLTLRTAATGASASNNSMGVAIIVDGVQQSNNANMQNVNIGTLGLSRAQITDSRYNGIYDATFSGLDLRNIPADNIESIEVVRGVASAQYGDITDGAVILNRQAGKTFYQFNARTTYGSTNYALAKGYMLGKRAGAINVNVNFLRSYQDPRNSVKSYDRVSTGVMWTSYLSKGIRNTLSVDYNTKFDDIKLDPEDIQGRRTFSKDRRLSIAERFSAAINSKYLKRINFNGGFSTAYSESYAEYEMRRGGLLPIASKDTTGVYEGYFVPGDYRSVQHTVGKPVNINATLSFLGQFNIGKVFHRFNLGTTLSTSSNKGAGVLEDPDNPRWRNQGNKNSRPYDFQLLPALVNLGIYAEDNFRIKVLNRYLSVTPGIRYDEQNGFGNFQPRINTSYQLSEQLQFTLAYGIATKSPTMAYRYPGPVYYDFPLITYRTPDNNIDQSLFLVYTQKVTPDNTDLKPTRSSQLEAGLKYNHSLFDVSVFAYMKKNRGGFNGISTPRSFIVPKYNYVVVSGQKPNYTFSGQYELLIGSSLTDTQISNVVNTNDYGAEIFVNTKKIEAIETSVGANASIIYSKYNNLGERYSPADPLKALAGGAAWWGVYNGNQYQNWAITSKFTTTTHIPKLGFVVNVIADVAWFNSQRTLDASNVPVAYLDKNLNRHPITSFDINNPDYGYLGYIGTESSYVKVPIVYGNISMRIAKEIRQRIRFAISAYNVFNLMPRYQNPETQQVYAPNSPVAVSAELSIKI
ncbi:TonB-dependent receptor [Mucilaginibacter sp. PAMB04168]|uniref:TonB-dependent receptor n=1 Tax=Mucilaginibacter sp. PAMB04168 TaxID=3138567 RepID=UPI0031F62207